LSHRAGGAPQAPWDNNNHCMQRLLQPGQLHCMHTAVQPPFVQLCPTMAACSRRMSPLEEIMRVQKHDSPEVSAAPSISTPFLPPSST
jgi:hypothetical protein